MTTRATDWDAYYQRPAAPTKITRKISEKKILGLLADRLPSASVCECGGANSCFIDAFLARGDVLRYHVIDYNEFGVSLLAARFTGSPTVSWEVGNLLEYKATEQFDLVYSVGLIEHFDQEGTSACVKAHFDLCRPGGVVLMTFPTPTALYRGIRGVAEVTGKWAFHDERPLSFAEVRAAAHECKSDELHSSINWAIGLTQGYLLFQKPL